MIRYRGSPNGHNPIPSESSRGRWCLASAPAGLILESPTDALLELIGGGPGRVTKTVFGLTVQARSLRTLSSRRGAAEHKCSFISNL